MEEPFAEVARDYDRMFLRDLDADRKMLVSLFDHYGTKTALDCACGTGVHTGMLAREGLEVVGSDASEAMLAIARSKLSAAGLAVDLYRSSWRDLPDVVPGKYDAVICMGNSLGLAPDGDEVVESLKGMYAMLNEGGFLLISNTNVDRQLVENIHIEVVEPEPECFLLNVREYGTVSTTSKYYFIDTSRGEPSLRHLDVELINLTVERLESFIRSSGIDRYSLYGEKDFAPYSQYQSERLILVAEKSADEDRK